MKRPILFAAAAIFAAPFVAGAQTTAPAPAGAAPAAGAPVATGATVYDTAGGVVGTVASTDGTNAVVDTGTVKAAIPLTSLGKGDKGPVLAMTKAQLDAAAGQQQQAAAADFKSKLVPGATVYGTGGTSVGTIKSVDASGVTLTTPNGEAKLPASGFGPGPSGVTLGMTAEQLAAAMNAAAPAPAAGATPAAGTTSDGTTATGDATAAPATTDAANTPGTTDQATTAAPGATTTTTPKSKKPRR